MKLFTSESVLPGHPDKLCDQISDSILDYALSVDRNAHMAVECTVKDNTVFVYGESGIELDKFTIGGIVADVLESVGYDYTPEVITRISRQSSEINDAVLDRASLGAGDQGIMFGYACNDLANCMPVTAMAANVLAKNLDFARKSDSEAAAILLPDGKTQVTVREGEDGKRYFDTVLVSLQHKADADMEALQRIVYKQVEKLVTSPLFKDYLGPDYPSIIVNPSGSFVLGGPFADSGTTGRKIVVDTYGGMGRIGGGCFSSKDPTKVDRSGAYYARKAAKFVVANGMADRCEIQAAYGIGMAIPISIGFDFFGTEHFSVETIEKAVQRRFDFRPQAMIEEMDLLRPIYAVTSTFGHFGWSDANGLYPWESVNYI